MCHHGIKVQIFQMTKVSYINTIQSPNDWSCIEEEVERLEYLNIPYLKMKEEELL